MDYEFEAFKKGFNDGMSTIFSVFDITNKDIKEKFSFDILNSQIFELYQIWQNTIKDEKITREDSILLKKVEVKIRILKKSIIRYIENYARTSK